MVFEKMNYQCNWNIMSLVFLTLPIMFTTRKAILSLQFTCLKCMNILNVASFTVIQLGVFPRQGGSYFTRKELKFIGKYNHKLSEV